MKLRTESLNLPLATSRTAGARVGLLAVLLVSTFFQGAADARRVYVANSGASNVDCFDCAAGQSCGMVNAGSAPRDVAITPDGTRAYVTNSGATNVTVINTSDNAVASTVELGALSAPSGVAISPDGTRAFVTEFGTDVVSVIDTGTNQVVIPDIPLGGGMSRPRGIAVTPDGQKVYVAIFGGIGGSTSVVAMNTDGTNVHSITVGSRPEAVAVSPDGTRAYVTNSASDSVSVIDTATDQAIGGTIPVGSSPGRVAVTPDGSRLYVANNGLGSVLSSILLSAGAVTPITVGALPFGVALTPDGSRAFASNAATTTVSAVSTASQSEIFTVTVGAAPRGIAVQPNQGPIARFTASERGGSSGAFDFDATLSSDPDGQVATYGWDFGDGVTAVTASPSIAHEYANSGTYSATLTVTDNEGASTERVFTGQTVLQNGGPSARASVELNVSRGSSTCAASLDVAVGAPKQIRLKDLARKRSFGVRVVSNQGATARLKAQVSGKNARRLGLARRKSKKAGARTVVSGSGSSSSTEASLSLRPSKKVRRALRKALRRRSTPRSVKLTLSAAFTATADAGLAKTLKGKLKAKKSRRVSKSGQTLSGSASAC